jgi:hypothetical protein
MILSGKRLASSPAEAEKKKPDFKTTSTEITGTSREVLSSYRDVASRGYLPPTDVIEDWDGGDSEGDSWQLSSSGQSRRRRWSTGRTPGGTPVSSPPQERRKHGQQEAPTSAGPNPAFIHKHTHPWFDVKNEGAFREELEVEILTINGNPFRGSLTHHEAKHRIYKEILGCPFSNFRGVRLGYRTCPTATFMLRKVINIDDLASCENFEFERKNKKRDGSEAIDKIGCKLRGVRTVTGSEATASYSQDWTRVVKIEGCNYRIQKDMIMEWLGFYGEIQTDLVEDVFEDSEDSEGENTTGVYSVKMKLHSNIPQFLPIDGRRIKIYYRNINKLCTNCFGEHNKRNCKEEKVKWIDYVDSFMKDNRHIDSSLFGKWAMILEREKKQRQIDREHYESKNPKEAEQRTEEQTEANLDHISNQKESSQQTQEIQSEHEKEETPDPNEPKPAEFNLPETDEEAEQLIKGLTELGLSNAEATAVIEKRRKQFIQALKKYETAKLKASKKGKNTKPRKDSLNDK